jgi:hypothetical protein
MSTGDNHIDNYDGNYSAGLIIITRRQFYASNTELGLTDVLEAHVKIQQRRELPVLKSVSGGEYFDMRAT